MTLKEKETKQDKRKEYNSRVAKLSITRDKDIKSINKEYYKNVRELQIEFDIESKKKPSKKDVVDMIGIILNNKKKGADVIKEYAERFDKNEKWVSDVRRSKPKSALKKALTHYKDHAVVIEMKKNGIYDSKEVTSRTLVGALIKLSKQLTINSLIVNLRLNIELLECSLNEKKKCAETKGVNKEKIFELHENGRKNVEIARILSCSESYVRKVLKSNCKYI